MQLSHDYEMAKASVEDNLLKYRCVIMALGPLWGLRTAASAAEWEVLAQCRLNPSVNPPFLHR